MARTIGLALLLLLGAKEGFEGLRLTVVAPWASEVTVWRVEPRGTWHRRIETEGDATEVRLAAGAEYLVTVADPERGLRAGEILTGRVVAGQRITVRPKPGWLGNLRLRVGPGITRVDSAVGSFNGFAGHRAMAGPDGPPRVLDSCAPADGAGEVRVFSGGWTALRVVTEAGPWCPTVGPWRATVGPWPEDLPFELEVPPVERVLVTDPDGRPVPGAHVELLGEGDVVQSGGSYKSGLPFHVGCTDAEGRLLVRRSLIGDRLIWAAAYGYSPARAEKVKDRWVARIAPVAMVTIPVKPPVPPGTFSVASLYGAHPVATAAGYLVPVVEPSGSSPVAGLDLLRVWGSGGFYAETRVAEGAVLKPAEPYRLTLRSDPPDDSVRFDLREHGRREALFYETLGDVPPGELLLPASWMLRLTMTGKGLSPVWIGFRYPEKPEEVVLPKVEGKRTSVVVTDPSGKALPWRMVQFTIRVDEVPDVVEAGVPHVSGNRYALTNEKGYAETLAPEGSEMWVMVSAAGLPRTRIDLKAGESGKIVVDPPGYLAVEGEPGRYRIDSVTKPGTLTGLAQALGEEGSVERELAPQDASGRLVLGPLPAGAYTISREGKSAKVVLKAGETATVKLR